MAFATVIPKVPGPIPFALASDSVSDQNRIYSVFHIKRGPSISELTNEGRFFQCKTIFESARSIAQIGAISNIIRAIGI